MTPLALIALASLALTLLLGRPFVNYLAAWKLGQSIRVEGPQSHHTKAGTPTMGGWIIVLPALLVGLGFAMPGGVSSDLVAVAATTLAYAGIGWLDDYLIIKRRHNKGLSARAKFGLQLLAGALFALYLGLSGHGTTLVLPVTHQVFDLGPLYYPFLVVVMASATNAVNLTDGLDGLAAGTMAIATAGLVWALVTLGVGPSDMEVAGFGAALIGACLGYLWYNGHPAQVFMGDTGSLALGGAIAAMAATGHLELFLIPLGGVFVAETLSVILQVWSFKTTGKRIFKMSPLHHHFELSGWPETRVVQRFYLVGALLALLTVSGL